MCVLSSLCLGPLVFLSVASPPLRSMRTCVVCLLSFSPSLHIPSSFPVAVITPFTLCPNSCRGSPSVIGSNVAHNWPVSSSCIMSARHSLCSKIYKGLWAKPQTSVHRLREVYWYIFRALNNFCFLLCWWKGVALYIEYSVCWRFHLDK